MQRFSTLLSLTIVIMACVTCAAADREPEFATRLVVHPGVFTDAEILNAKSLPLQFELSLRREMPTPGWQFKIDSVEVDTEQHRIVAHVTEIGPQGMVAQVLTTTNCIISLGKLKPGAYLVEIRMRRGTAGKHSLAQALMLVAK